MKQNFDRMENLKKELAWTIEDLDIKLNRVITKQEYDYLSGYSMFVSKKSSQLKAIIDKINEKNSGTSLKDDKIQQLELIIHSLRNDAIQNQEVNMTKNDEVKQLKDKLD